MITNKIVLYLLNEKGYSVLKKIIEQKLESLIEYIIIGKDKKLTNDFSKEITYICNQNKIKFYFREEKIPKFEGVKFSIGWRWIISDFENLIVLHDSLLPKYRGFSPLVNALINGENEVGVTALFATNNYDEGDIILQKKTKISYPIKIKDAIKKVSSLYEDIIIELIYKIKKIEKIEGTKQSVDQATYSLWRDETDYFIDWNLASEEIKRSVDALGEPYEGAKAYLDKTKIVLDEVSLVQDVEVVNRKKNIGKVIFLESNKPIVICGKGLLKIEKAYNFETKESILPLSKFRVRFE